MEKKLWLEKMKKITKKMTPKKVLFFYQKGTKKAGIPPANSLRPNIVFSTLLCNDCSPHQMSGFSYQPAGKSLLLFLY